MERAIHHSFVDDKHQAFGVLAYTRLADGRDCRTYSDHRSGEFKGLMERTISTNEFRVSGKHKGSRELDVIQSLG
jgi:hypothetical protein